jgi:putative membrane protein
MSAQLMSLTAYAHAHPGWSDGYGPWNGSGPGWWLIFPILFWVLVLSAVGYFMYRRSPRQSARHAAERTLAERYARGEISADELKQRRAVVRGKP